MDFHRLAVFHAAARLGSFSRAAETLHTSQPNVSKHIARLEAQLGIILFHRLGGGIELTEAGRIVLDYAQRAAMLSDEMRRALAELLGLERGSLQLGASSTPGLYLLPKVVAGFQELHPGLHISLEISNSDRTAECTLAGELDLGFVGRRIVAKGLQTQAYVDDELVLIAAPGHKLAWRANVSADELSGETFIFREQGSGTRHAMEVLLERLELSPARTLEMGSSEAVKQAVAAGLGVSLVSGYAIDLERAHSALVVLEGPALRVVRQLYMLTRKDARPSAASLAFAAFLGK